MTRVTTAAFMVQNVLYTSIVLVAPSIILSSVTGMDNALAMALIGCVGTVYTAFGGFRAVVWADVLQAAIMFMGILAIIVKGCINAGGLSAMLDINREHGRLTMYSWNFDPWERSSFWNVFFGQSVMWTSLLSTNQPAVQRLLSLPTYKKSAITLFLGTALIMLIATLSCTSGLAIFATYADCDPMAAGSTTRRDQVVPHFVSEQFSQVPGLAGLFLACVLSGALSTVSSSLNSLAAVFWEDFLKRCGFAGRLSDTQRAWILRGSACGFGLVTLALAFLAKNMGSVIQVAISVYGGVAGPILAVFCLAVLVPFSNPAGTVTGLVAGMVMALWVSFGSFFSDLPPPTTLPSRTDGCGLNATVPSTAATFYSNSTLLYSDDAVDIERAPLESFYSISYFLFSLLGFLTTFVIGVVGSLLTGGSWIEVDPDHLCPLVRWIPTGKKPPAVNGNGKPNPAFEMEGKYAPKCET